MKNRVGSTKSRRARATENASPFINLLICGSKAAGVAFLAALVVILAGAFIGISLKDPAKCAEPIGLSAFFISFFVCGFISSKLNRGTPIVTGLISATIYLVPLLIVSLMLKLSSGGSGTRALLSLLSLPCSVIGAFFGNVRIARRKTAAQLRRRR